MDKQTTSFASASAVGAGAGGQEPPVKKLKTRSALEGGRTERNAAKTASGASAISQGTAISRGMLV